MDSETNDLISTATAICDPEPFNTVSEQFAEWFKVSKRNEASATNWLIEELSSPKVGGALAQRGMTIEVTATNQKEEGRVGHDLTIFFRDRRAKRTVAIRFLQAKLHKFEGVDFMYGYGKAINQTNSQPDQPALDYYRRSLEKYKAEWEVNTLDYLGDIDYKRIMSSRKKTEEYYTNRINLLEAGLDDDRLQADLLHREIWDQRECMFGCDVDGGYIVYSRAGVQYIPISVVFKSFNEAIGKKVTGQSKLGRAITNKLLVDPTAYSFGELVYQNFVTRWEEKLWDVKLLKPSIFKPETTKWCPNEVAKISNK